MSTFWKMVAHEPAGEMKYGQLPGLGKPVSRLIQGTLMLLRSDADEAAKLLDEVTLAGCTAFDTAVLYGNGRAERALGQWISARGVRDRVVIIDKGGHPDLNGSRVTPKALAEDLSRSLDQLGVESVDLYLLHRDDPSVPVSELIDFLNERARAGQVGAFGASNWSPARIAEANLYATRTGKLGFVASAPEFSLAVPVNTWPGCLSIAGESGRADRAWYGAERLPVLAWSPLGSGFLCGGYRADVVPTSAQQKRTLHRFASATNFVQLERLHELAQQKGVSPAQLALRYVLDPVMDVYATVGCANGAEFRDAVAALSVGLSTREREWLEASS